jgi:hypothetical protein
MKRLINHDASLVICTWYLTWIQHNTGIYKDQQILKTSTATH